MLFISILGILLLLFLIVILFVMLSPQFGGSPTDEQIANYAKSENYETGKFVNYNRVKLDMSFKDMRKSMVGYFNAPANTSPSKDIPVLKIDSSDVADYNGKTRLVWFGHSAFLLQISSKTILIDPMFGKVAAPHPLLGPNRFSEELPIEIERLPKIDAVIISHDHYDHLDYGSIKRLKDKVGMFYTPLGVGVHLEEWDIQRERIKELDWWQEVKFDGLTFACTPAQHFSGRGFSDRQATLWASWVINSDTERLFFSGDSGYGTHFKEIGKKYGPFDFAMLECGQYNTMWPEIHMFPEETAQAGVDVGAKRIMPIHWGAFKLAMHSWTDPVERVAIKAKELDIDLLIPKIGAPIFLNDDIDPVENWWE